MFDSLSFLHKTTYTMRIIHLLITALLSACTLLPEKKDASQSPTTIISLNLRYDNPADAPSNWENRKEWVAQLINYHQPAAVGMQEVLINQLNDLKHLLPDYDFIGVARDDGKEEGEFSPIFFNRNQLQLTNNNTLWLSQTPEVPGSWGWDAVCRRVVTKGEFIMRDSGKRLTIINTHFDHVGEQARQESAIIIKKLVSDYAGKEPVIVTGDFNAHPQSSVYKELTTQSPLADTYDLANVRYGTEWTFHDFGRLAMEERERIDYVFVTQGIEVIRHQQPSEQRGDRFMTDHNPVIVELSIK